MTLCDTEHKWYLKFKIVYFVTSVYRSIKLKHKNINKQKERDAYDLQNIKKSGAVFLYFDCFYSFILAEKYCHLFVIHHHTLYGNLLKYNHSGYTTTFAMKIAHNAT